MMRTRSILFTLPMVLAILAGRKSQTRRVMSVQPPAEAVVAVGIYHPTVIDRNGMEQPGAEIYGATWADGEHTLPSPYGPPGDGLKVREEHYRFGHWQEVPGETTSTGRQKWAFVADSEDVLFAAPSSFRRARSTTAPASPAWHKRLARFMPAKLSRILLQLRAVRVERLQDISEADAVAEGIGLATDSMKSSAAYGIYYCRMPDGKIHYSDNAVELFKRLWEQINGAGSWAANPWVWINEFSVIEASK
jgi:hypothetical protein